MFASKTEIGRTSTTAYAVSFAVCANNEVLRDRLGLDPDLDHAVTTEARAAAVSEIVRGGSDYELCRDFREYNGGPRKQLVEANWFVADLDADGEAEGWRPVWLRGPGKTEIPAEFLATADKIETAAGAAMDKVAHANA